MKNNRAHSVVEGEGHAKMVDKEELGMIAQNLCNFISQSKTILYYFMTQNEWWYGVLYYVFFFTSCVWTYWPIRKTYSRLDLHRESSKSSRKMDIVKILCMALKFFLYPNRLIILFCHKLLEVSLYVKSKRKNVSHFFKVPWYMIYMVLNK